MKLPKIDLKNRYNKGLEKVQNGYKKHIKPTMDKGIKYTRELSHDTVDFVRKNPRKTGMIAAAGALILSLGAIALTAFKEVKKTRQEAAEQIDYYKEVADIKGEHISHQREIIDGLNDDIADKQRIIDALHDAVDAAHGELQKRKNA